MITIRTYYSKLIFLLFLLASLPHLLYTQTAAKVNWKWALSAGEQDYDRANDITIDSQGNSYVVGRFENNMDWGTNSYISNGGYDFFLAKVDSSGNLIWLVSDGGINHDYAESVVLHPNGHIYISGAAGAQFEIGGLMFSGGDAFIAEYDTAGNFIQVHLDGGGGNDSYLDLIVDGNGDIYAGGYFSNGSTGAMFDTVSITGYIGTIYRFPVVVKYSPQGNVYWASYAVVDTNEFFLAGGEVAKLALAPNGDAYATGSFRGELFFAGDSLENKQGTDYECLLMKISPNGQAQWLRGGGGQEKDYGTGVAMNPFGQVVMYGTFEDTANIAGVPLGNPANVDDSDLEIMLVTFDPAGNVVDHRVIFTEHPTVSGCNGSEISGDIYYDAQWNMYLSGRSASCGSIDFGNGFKIDPPPSYGTFIVKIAPIDSVLMISFMGNTPTLARTYITDFAFGPGDYMAMSGYQEYIGFSGTANTLFDNALTVNGFGEDDVVVAGFRDGTSFPGGSSFITGQIYDDMNQNCQRDSGELPLVNRLIRADPGPYWAFTDSTGKYEFQVGADSFQVRQQLNAVQSLTTTPICPVNPASQGVVTIGLGDTLSGIDFSNEVRECQLLRAEVSSFTRRLCFKNTTRIFYENAGDFTVFNANVYLKLPSEVLMVQADSSFQLMPDGTYRFPLGDVPSGFWGYISIIDSVKCGDPISKLGLSQCTEVWVTPISDCFPINSNWDEANLSVIADCQNGIGTFQVRNEGIGNMADSTTYRLYQNSSLVWEQKLKLLEGDSLSLQMLANGAYLRMTVDQVPYHPYNVRAIGEIEGCALAPNDTISTGHAAIYNPNTGDITRDADCMVITGSYDPNDKLATPIGVTNQHIVPTQTPLDYKIRFQNSGTDTAFKVVIIDTLSNSFDIASLQMGAASHPFQYAISGTEQPVLTVTFSPILLPDSNVNPLGSQGFVSFTIHPDSTLTQGTVIENFADIYFDFNPPIRTNTTLHTFLDTTFGQPAPSLVELCLGSPSVAFAGMDSSFCELDSISLSASLPTNGIGVWQIDSSSGEILQPYETQSQVRLLDYGQTWVTWTVQLCEQVSIDTLWLGRDQQISQPMIVQSGDTLFADEMGSEYLWYLDGVLLANSTDYIIPNQTGNYQVEVISGACTSDLSEPYSFISSGIDYLLASDIRLYPNPVEEVLHIIFQSHIATSKTFRLYDVSGKLQNQKSFDLTPGEQHLTWELSHLPDGIYVLYLGEFGVRKVVIGR